jgi:tetratricopeptide (TPR) repeat protein
MINLVLVLLALPQMDTVERARILAEKGQVTQAINFLESKGREEPSPQVFAFLAQLQTAMDRIPQAAQSLERALDLAPRQHRLRVTRAALLYRMRKLDEARKELEMVLRQVPSDGLAHYYLASVYQMKGEYEVALDSAEKAAELMPAPSVSMSFEKQKYSLRANALHLIAEIRFELGQDVETLVREVLRLEPLHTSARYLLSKILSAQGKIDEARHELVVFNDIKKADEHVEFALNSLQFGGRVQQAVTSLLRAIDYFPNHDRALFFLGRLLLQVGQVEQGSQYLERCVEIRPEAAELVNPLLEKHAK